MSLARTDTEEADWLEWRRGGITATEVADAANGTYGGAYAVVARKLGKLPRTEQTEQMARGHRWQPTIADAVHVLTGRYVVGEELWCQHPTHPTHRATVDGFLADAAEVSTDDLDELLEVKTRGTGTRPNRARWADQVQWQMWVTGIDRATIAEASIDDDTDECRGVRLMRLEADRDRQAFLVSIAEELWSHVTAGTLPAPDDPSALAMVKAVHPSADPTLDVVDLSSIASDVARFAAIKAAVKDVTDERDLIEARIREAMGEATRGAAGSVVVSLSAPSKVLDREAEAELLAARPDLGKVVLDRDLAKEVAPDLYDAARRPIGARRLTTKELTR